MLLEEIPGKEPSQFHKRGPRRPRQVRLKRQPVSLRELHEELPIDVVLVLGKCHVSRQRNHDTTIHLMLEGKGYRHELFINKGTRATCLQSADTLVRWAHLQCRHYESVQLSVTGDDHHFSEIELQSIQNVLINTQTLRVFLFDMRMGRKVAATLASYGNRLYLNGCSFTDDTFMKQLCTRDSPFECLGCDSTLFPDGLRPLLGPSSVCASGDLVGLSLQADIVLDLEETVALASSKITHLEMDPCANLEDGDILIDAIGSGSMRTLRSLKLLEHRGYRVHVDFLTDLLAALGSPKCRLRNLHLDCPLPSPESRFMFVNSLQTNLRLESIHFSGQYPVHLITKALTAIALNENIVQTISIVFWSGYDANLADAFRYFLKQRRDVILHYSCQFEWRETNELGLRKWQAELEPQLSFNRFHQGSLGCRHMVNSDKRTKLFYLAVQQSCRSPRFQQLYTVLNHNSDLLVNFLER